MNGLILYLKEHTVHTPRLALARFFLALGMLITIISNRMDVVANHHYGHMEGYTIRHGSGGSNAFAFADLYMMMPPAIANGIVVAILLLVMTGLAPRITGILHFIACFSYHNYFIILNGGDDLTLNFALLLVPLCLTDPRMSQWKSPAQPSKARTSNIVANIAFLAIQAQVAWIYFDAFYPKLFTPQWADGTAIFYYVSHYRLGAPDWLRDAEFLLIRTSFVKILSWGALALELLLACAIFLPAKWKHRLLLPALLFHFLILINFGLITFFIALCGMLLLYLDADDFFTNRILRRTTC